MGNMGVVFEDTFFGWFNEESACLGALVSGIVGKDHLGSKLKFSRGHSFGFSFATSAARFVFFFFWPPLRK